MKYLLILLLLAAGCKKSGQCYECEFGVINGYKPPNENYCGPMPWNKKINGVDVNTFCTPK